MRTPGPQGNLPLACASVDHLNGRVGGETLIDAHDLDLNVMITLSFLSTIDPALQPLLLSQVIALPSDDLLFRMMPSVAKN